jgi:hypothetical protein
MKKLVSIALLGAFLVVTNVGCGDSKPAPKTGDTKESKDGPPGRTVPKPQ